MLSDNHGGRFEGYDRLGRVVPGCPRCHAFVDFTDRFCRSCGGKLGFVPARIWSVASRNPSRHGIGRRAAGRVVLVAACLAIASAVVFSAVAPRPSSLDIPTTKVLLDIQGRHLREKGSSFLIIRSPDADGYQYASFRLEWSASAPLRLEMGTFESGCEWLSIGGSAACGNLEAAQASGDRTIPLDPAYSGTIWFFWQDGRLDGDGVDVSRLKITASLA